MGSSTELGGGLVCASAGVKTPQQEITPTACSGSRFAERLITSQTEQTFQNLTSPVHQIRQRLERERTASPESFRGSRSGHSVKMRPDASASICFSSANTHSILR